MGHNGSGQGDSAPAGRAGRPGRVRLSDVAAAVGVSAKTVSNVVHGTGMVSDPVREKVLAAIDELGYRPNLAARQLRGGTNSVIALVMPDLRNPYFAEFSSDFFAAAQRRSLTILVSQTRGKHAAERDLIDGVGLPALDGVVMSPLSLTREDVAARRSTIPLVLIGEHGESLATGDVTHVGIDNVAAARAATLSLIDKGRRRVGVVGVQDAGSTATSRMRFDGYLSALTQAGLEFDPALVGHVEDFNRADGYAATRRLITSGVEFDALFCFSDSLAFGALYALATHAIAVPDAVRVIGFDNIEEGRFTQPPFDTVGLDYVMASERILDVITMPSARRGGHIEIPYEVIVREAVPTED